MTGVSDDFVPPKYIAQTILPTPGPSTTSIIDPLTGVRYPVPTDANGDTPITPDGRTLNQLVYPSGAPDAPSAGFPPPNDVSSDGAPVAGPIAPPAGTTQIFIASPTSGTDSGAPTPGSLPGYVRPLVNIQTVPAQPLTQVDAGLNAVPTSTGSQDSGVPWLLVAVGAAILGLFIF